MHAREPGSSYHFAERPGYCQQYGDESQEVIDQAATALYSCRMAAFTLSIAYGDQYNSDQHHQRVLYRPEAHDGIFHHRTHAVFIDKIQSHVTDSPLVQANQQGEVRGDQQRQTESFVSFAKGLVTGRQVTENTQQQKNQDHPSQQVMCVQ